MPFAAEQQTPSLVCRGSDTTWVSHREDFEAFVRVSELHQLHPAIAKAFELKDLRAAIDCVEKGGYLGKVVLKLDF